MRRSALTALLVAVALTAGCGAYGIRPTGVVAAGAPATGVDAPDQYLYFVVGRQVQPMDAPPPFSAQEEAAYIPPVEYGGRPQSEHLQAALFRGLVMLFGPPRGYLEANRVGTAIPTSVQLSGPPLLVGGTSVEVPLSGASRLSATALVQIGCTVHSALNLGPATWSGDVRVSFPAGSVVAPCPPAVRDALPFAASEVPVG